ncbi:MAG: PAS domain S-box protein [Gemmatimonadetes bacterium]|nr:MAG: PAS domain S-box protein [Gemmatimonadota bacterium]
MEAKIKRLEHQLQDAVPADQVNILRQLVEAYRERESNLTATYQAQIDHLKNVELAAVKAFAQFNEKQLRDLIEHTIDGIIILDEQTRIIFINPAGERLLNRAAKTLLNRPFEFPLVIGDQMMEITIDRGDDAPTFAELRMATITWQGKPAFLASLRDITDRKRVEAELREKNRIITEQKEEIEIQNRYLTRALQELEDIQVELVRKNSLIFDQKEVLAHQNEQLRQTLSELERTRQQLVDSEKIASLSVLVAGVAHEVNTPVGIGVTAASTLVELTRSFVERYNADQINSSDLESYVQEVYRAGQLILTNLQRAAALVQNFKQISVDHVTEERRHFALKPYLETVIASLKPKFKHKAITIEIDCPPEIELESYPGIFAQILTNLLINSLIHGFEDRQQGYIRIGATQQDDQLVLTYQDDGQGIPPDIRPNVFDPFFTTNKTVGTGLGLYLIHNLVVQQLKGTISLESPPEGGVLVTLNLPLNPEEDAA